MASVSKFLTAKKIKKENTTYVATKSLVDEEGNPLEWTIKPLTTKEHEKIRDDSTDEIPIKGKRGAYRQKFDISRYQVKIICASVVDPNLYDKELQDLYDVLTPEDLIKELIDNPGEYTDFANFIQEYNGFDVSFEDKVEEAKNA